MKKTVVLSFLLLQFCCGSVFAQQLSTSMQAVFDVCKDLSMAVGSGNTSALKAANKRFKACAVNPFSSLTIEDKNPLSLDGHFVFNEDFVDSLIAGREVYQFAQKYADVRRVRGVSTGKIYIKTCAVRKNSSTKLTFPSRGHQELAVVAEPKSMLTLRIHDTSHNKWYKDTKNVKKGQPLRTFIFDLPTDERSLLEVEVMNTGNRDCSFVIISN